MTHAVCFWWVSTDTEMERWRNCNIGSGVLMFYRYLYISKTYIEHAYVHSSVRPFVSSASTGVGEDLTSVSPSTLRFRTPTLHNTINLSVLTGITVIYFLLLNSTNAKQRGTSFDFNKEACRLYSDISFSSRAFLFSQGWCVLKHGSFKVDNDVHRGCMWSIKIKIWNEII